MWRWWKLWVLLIFCLKVPNGDGINSSPHYWRLHPVTWFRSCPLGSWLLTMTRDIMWHRDETLQEENLLLASPSSDLKKWKSTCSLFLDDFEKVLVRLVHTKVVENVVYSEPASSKVNQTSEAREGREQGLIGSLCWGYAVCEDRIKKAEESRVQVNWGTQWFSLTLMGIDGLALSHPVGVSEESGENYFEFYN